MEIRAYSEIYLNKAQNNLKHAADFAITSLNLNPDVFGNAFALSSVSKQFGCGNPHVCCQDKRMRKANPDTQLKTRRINNRLSQSELASSSGVALRQIQLFEQRQRNINNAAAITLFRLSKALHCSIEEWSTDNRLQHS